jgi:20S proteasome alpha/beta subunit
VTLLVGVLCGDGVVLAADSAVTMAGGPGQLTITHPARKIEIIAGKLIIAGTGQMGLGQRFCAVVDRMWPILEVADTPPVEVGRSLCQHTVNDFASTRTPAGGLGALVAFPSKGAFHLCEFQVADFQPELKTEKLWYVSMGSGQSLADPYLALIRKVFWSKGPPNVEDGIFAAVWVMHHAIKAAVGFVGPPIDVAILAKDGASMLPTDRVQEHLENVEAADEYFASWKTSGGSARDLPPPPPPNSIPPVEPGGS